MPKSKGKAGHLARSHKLASLSEHLSRGTHFNNEECKTLVQFHERLEEHGVIDRPRFREICCIIFAITDDVMLDLVFRAFDRDNNGVVDDNEWVRGLSVMLRGTLDELIEYTYFVYDMNGDRSLAREELYHCLKGCMYAGFGIDEDEIEDCERDIVEIAMKKLDTDHDGQITYEDFINAVKTDPLILQACGPCLPTSRRIAAFLSLVTDRYRSYSSVYPGMPLAKKYKTNSGRRATKVFRVGQGGVGTSRGGAGGGGGSVMNVRSVSSVASTTHFDPDRLSIVKSFQNIQKDRKSGMGRRSIPI